MQNVRMYVEAALFAVRFHLQSLGPIETRIDSLVVMESRQIHFRLSCSLQMT